LGVKIKDFISPTNHEKYKHNRTKLWKKTHALVQKSLEDKDTLTLLMNTVTKSLNFMITAKVAHSQKRLEKSLSDIQVEIPLDYLGWLCNIPMYTAFKD